MKADLLSGTVRLMQDSGKLLAISVLLCACPDAPMSTATEAATTGTQGTVGGGSTDTIPTSSSTSTEATTALETGADTTAASCGNGVIEDDEACDDGNLVNGDGCNQDCTVSAALVWEYRSGIEGDDGLASGWS